MVDKVTCLICGHSYIFNGNNKQDHYIWSCEVLAEVNKCAGYILSRHMIAIANYKKTLKWSDLEKELNQM